MIGIRGTGRALPKSAMTNEDFAKIVDTSDEWIVSRTGIRSRQIAKDETALDLCVEAARHALDSAHIDPQDLGLIVVATVTPDTATPSMACLVLKELGATCPAFDLNAACSGFLYGVIAAQALSPDRPALVIGCELLSRVTNYQDRTTCVLFGDGAGAAVIAPTEGPGAILAERYMAYPDEKNSLIIHGLNCGPEDMKGRSYLIMDGQEVYKFATRVLTDDIEWILQKAAIGADEVAWYIPHQANIRIIKTAASRIKVPIERFYTNIERTGNTSSASIPIALDELLRSGQTKTGDLILLSAFGGGLTSGSLLFRV